jgi:Spy/CpxP family protein refolding chaperone
LALLGPVGVDAAGAWAGGGQGCYRGGTEQLERRLDRLELDAETQAAVDRVMDGARIAGRAQRKQLWQAREQMRALLEQDTPAVEAVMAQADAIGALEVAMQKQRLRTVLELRVVVGAERWKELGLGMRHDRS